jgi:hypothetical protein
LDALTALTEAKKVLQPLYPEGANDPETLGIWGALHKRLAEHPERSPEQQGPTSTPRSSPVRRAIT